MNWFQELKYYRKLNIHFNLWHIAYVMNEYQSQMLIVTSDISLQNESE